MRKISFGILLMSISFIANGQFNKNETVIGGNFNFDIPYRKFSFQVTTDNSFSLYGGKAIKNNLLLGVKYSNAQSKNYTYFHFNETSYKSNSSLNEYAVFIRKYWHLKGKFYAFAEIEGGLKSTFFEYMKKSPTEISLRAGRSSGIYTAFTPGIAYKFNKNVQLELSFPSVAGLSFVKGTNYQDGNYSTFKNNSFLSGFKGNSKGLVSVGVKINF